MCQRMYVHVCDTYDTLTDVCNTYGTIVDVCDTHNTLVDVCNTYNKLYLPTCLRVLTPVAFVCVCMCVYACAYM